MILHYNDMTPRRPRRSALGALATMTIAHAAPGLSIGQTTTEAPNAPPQATSLYFTPALAPAPVDPAPALDEPVDLGALVFEPGAIIDTERLAPDAHQSPLTVLSELMLLRAHSPDAEPISSSSSSSTHPDAAEGFSLRFEDAAGDHSLWDRTDAEVSTNRWELLPALFLRSGRVYEEGYESIDYADLYAELGVDLTLNTGIWLRYERLRQALGSAREGEQRDADALYLQFELRF